MDKLVRDLMHPGMITCKPDTPLGQVAVLLDHHHVHALIVADRDGRPLGVITDFDLLAAEWLSTDQESLEAMRRMTAGELMTFPIDTIEATAEVCDAAARMRQEGISRLLVEEQGKPIGVISVSDFVASLVEAQSIERRTVADVMSRAMLVCRENTPVAYLARAMTDAGYRSVLVVTPSGRPVGVVSGADLLPFCGDEDAHKSTAAQVMHEMLTIAPTATLREAADRMIDHHHHRLVVVDEQQPETIPLGVISTYDIVGMMAQPGSIWRR
jgi:CBS domain-containing protein